MAFQTGTQVNAALGRTDYTPFLQGAMQGAQAQARGAENIAAGLAGLGQQVATGIEKYYKKQEEKRVKQQGIDFIVKHFGVDKEAAAAGLDALPTGAYIGLLQGDREKQTNEQAAQYANLLNQSGGTPVSLESGPMSPVAEMRGREAFARFQNLQSETAKNLAATNKQPVEFGVVKVPKTDPKTGITTVSVVDSRTGKEVSTYVEQSPITIGAPAPGTVTKINPDGTITSVAIAGAPKTEEQLKREEVAAAQKTAKTNFGNHIKSAFSNIIELNKKGAMVNPDNDIFTNVTAKIGSSALGQAIGGTGGSEVASIQKQLVKLQPLMITALADATGIKASQLSSNKELEFYLNAMADPNTDFYSNLAALDSLSRQVVGEDIVGQLLQDNPAMLSRIRRESIGFQNKNPLKLGVSANGSSASKSDNYVVGQTYRDANGNEAVYQGKGVFK